MHIQIDQSGKIENTKKNTVIAFSNGNSKSILIDRREKRLLQDTFRNHGRGQIFIFETFAILIFLLIKKDIHCIQHISIDTEYSGKEVLIKDFLLRLIRKHRSFDKRDVDFIRIGRKAKAHEIAINVYRKRKKPDIIVSSNKVLVHATLK